MMQVAMRGSSGAVPVLAGLFFPCADDPVLSFSRIRCSAPTGATDQEASAGSHRGRRYFYLHALQHSTCPIQVTCAMR